MRPVRFGLVGFGEWARWHARFIKEIPEAHLVAVADSDKEKRKIATRDFGVKTYSDYNKLIKEENLDVVDILLPNYLHHKAAITALQSGNNVLLEKPMALTVEDCDSILKFSQKSSHQDKKPFLAIGFELRFSSLWERVKNLIQEGKIGTVRAVHIEVFRSAPSTGSGEWRLNEDQVGSWMLDAPIHYFDLIRWYFEGVGEPQSLYSSANSSSERALVDNLSTIINFSGGCGVLFYSMAGYGYYIIAKVIGDKGALWAHWEEVEEKPFEPKFWLEYGQNKVKHKISIERKAGETFDLKAEIKQVVKAVQEGAPIPATGQDGKEAVRMCLAAERSLSSGKAVKL
ncbi:MAG: Gfo/Idh/MocA family oxidoreductase [Candidatus Aerophobetes bacterium]|nr:Gfo/Idh/MocA family oxidoreductase [Candidatus Aerophobetes bacterium]